MSMKLLDIREPDFLRKRTVMLAVADALGVIDPGVSGYEVTCDTGNGCKRSNFGPEELHGHNDGCQWRISCTAKTATKPIPASMPKGRCKRGASAFPKVAPM